jgi:hypothetical protein
MSVVDQRWVLEFSVDRAPVVALAISVPGQGIEDSEGPSRRVIYFGFRNFLLGCRLESGPEGLGATDD